MRAAQSNGWSDMTTRPTDTPCTTNKRTIMDGNSTSQASKRLAIIVAVLTFCAGSVGAQHSHAAGVWTNEPAGANVVVDCNFSSTPGACGILDAYSSAEVASDSSAPLSPSGVLKSTLRAGNSHHLRLHPIRLPPSRPAAQSSPQFIRAIRLAACNSTIRRRS